MVLLTTKRLLKDGLSLLCFLNYSMRINQRCVLCTLDCRSVYPNCDKDLYIQDCILLKLHIVECCSMRECISKKIFKKLVKERAQWGNNIALVNADHGDNRTLGCSRICTKTQQQTKRSPTWCSFLRTVSEGLLRDSIFSVCYK